MTSTALDFAPLLPWPVIIGLASVGLLVIALGAWQRMSGWLWRAFGMLGLALVLANPALVEEERDPLSDIAVLVTDRSSSMAIGERTAAADAMADALRAEAESDPLLDLIEVEAGETADGTMLFDAINTALAGTSRDRLAGVIVTTDGQVHDLPQDAEGLGLDAPLHVAIAGDRNAGDRRLIIEEAPRYGIVGQSAVFVVRIEDDTMQGTANVAFRFEGGEPQTHRIPIGRDTRVEIPVERRGQNVIEVEVEAGPQELTLINNHAAVSVNGVRDRLRVLLVTGEPHNGARAWRDLLKSDPSVDLVHFTILRPPDRRDNTPVNELALIGFPVRELFEERLQEFDLVIFDRYRRRGNIIAPLYYTYIASYVEAGGALLVTAGPPFAQAPSLARTPLAAVLPIRPTGQISTGPFTPELTDTGQRHPVSAGLDGGGETPDWGRWMRHINGTSLGGEILLQTPDENPLLVVQRFGQGRAAVVMSDQTWLWARGFEGGGPYAEMFRRVSHWLMREPELDEERLTAFAADGELRAERVTLEDEAPPLQITWPDGRQQVATMDQIGNGVFNAAVTAEGTGLVRLRSGDLTTVAALGPLNPIEYADMRPTDALLEPFVQANGGGRFFINEGRNTDLPSLRRTRAQADQAGRSWLGLQRNERYLVRAATRAPLLPALLMALFLALMLGLGWWREGK